jgi:branched-chain amino acid transport system ATP-binding protein
MGWSPCFGGEASMSSEALIRVEGLVKSFGGFVALNGVNFHVMPGEIVGLVGPNGSGKTTCINVISGLYAPQAGTIRFAGREIGGLASHKLVHLGINRTFQVPKPFLPLSVRDNVSVAAHFGGRDAETDLEALLEEVGLGGLGDKIAGDLNSVQQKMLDLARALATRPKLLCVDELAAGLNPAELDGVARHLRALAEGGMALIVVEHLMGFIDQVTDRVVVLESGHNIFDGVLADAVRDPHVIEIFLGADHDD